MCAVYAFARRIDDIGDGDLQPAEKLRRLDEQTRALAAIAPSAARGEEGAARGEVGAAWGEDPVLIALADACARFAIPADALQALIDGVRMDVEGVRYETFEELLIYCRRVAGAIGRACMAIFALRDPAGTDREQACRLADDLGVALQLTNILRDLGEDARSGRLYLPAEDLRRFEVEPIRGVQPICGEREPGRLDELVRFEAARAREWFARGIAIVPLLDRRSRACVLAMAGIYSRLLRRIAADPQRAMRERVALSMREKAWVAARGMLGGGI